MELQFFCLSKKEMSMQGVMFFLLEKIVLDHVWSALPPHTGQAA